MIDNSENRGMRLVRPSKGGGSGGTSTPRRYCRITAGSGSTAPFVYSAVEIERTSSHGWQDKSGGTTMTANLYAYREDDFPGCGKLPVGTRVPFQSGASGEYLTDVVAYPPVYG